MEFPPLTFPPFLNQSGYQVKNILCSSGLHVFQFSSDYSPLHEELTKKTKQNKTIISENPVWMSQSKYLKSNN